MKNRIKHVLVIAAVAFILMPWMLSITAVGGGLVDDTVNPENLYSEYSLDNYQLDFYVDTSWDWLPWNWGEGISNKFEQVIFAITDALWWVSRTLSSATGYAVQEAYNLDFISMASDAIGRNIQELAGISSSGFRSTGFYPGLLLLLTLIVGMYVACVGLIKHEATKAVSAVVNFVLVIVISAGFIAYAPDYVAKVNDFSADLSNSALSVGAKIVMPGTETDGGTDLIRDNLFAMQIKQPWLLLQFGTTDAEALGDRPEALLAVDPDAGNGRDREQAVIREIENHGNMHMSVNKVAGRLGMVLLLLLVNIVISVFVMLFAGLMIFSQILFIMYATMLPLSLLLSTIPTFSGLARRSLEKVFNAVLLRVGYTIIITVAFSISSMLYILSADMPLLFVCLIQIVIFAGIFIKQNDLLSMIMLKGNDNQNLVRRTKFGAKRMGMKARRMYRNMSGKFHRMNAGSSGRDRKGSTEKTETTSSSNRNTQSRSQKQESLHRSSAQRADQRPNAENATREKHAARGHNLPASDIHRKQDAEHDPEKNRSNTARPAAPPAVKGTSDRPEKSSALRRPNEPAARENIQRPGRTYENKNQANSGIRGETVTAGHDINRFKRGNAVPKTAGRRSAEPGKTPAVKRSGIASVSSSAPVHYNVSRQTATGPAVPKAIPGRQDRHTHKRLNSQSRTGQKNSPNTSTNGKAK